MSFIYEDQRKLFLDKKNDRKFYGTLKSVNIVCDDLIPSNIKKESLHYMFDGQLVELNSKIFPNTFEVWKKNSYPSENYSKMFDDDTNIERYILKSAKEFFTQYEKELVKLKNRFTIVEIEPTSYKKGIITKSTVINLQTE